MHRIEILFVEHGMVVMGGVPIGPILDGIVGEAESRGYDTMDPGIAHAIDASMVIGSQESLMAWRAEIAEAAQNLPEEEKWLKGTDVGISSMTMFCVFTKRAWPMRLPPSVPFDSDDFGRCVRLLARFPRWRERLPEVAEAHPEWNGLVENWADLENLYASERYSDLDQRMAAMRDG